jgi:hypothetical protein
MFALQPGEVSDAIEGPNGYYIYKVEEERRVDESGNVLPADAPAGEDGQPAGTREIRVRQLFIEAKVTEEEQAAIVAQAQALADRAAELGDLTQAATEAGHAVALAGPFTIESSTIDGIPTGDVLNFRNAFREEEVAPYNVITARENVYVAVQDLREDGVIPPFEDVREDVKQAFMRESPKYKDKVREYTEKMKAAKSLDEARTIAVDNQAEIGELQPFTRKDQLWQQQFYIMPTQIYEEVGREPIGTMAGPLQDFLANTYFIELSDRTAPTEEDKAKWPEEKQMLRDQIASRKGLNLIEDYALHLRQTKLPQTMVRYNTELINQIVGRNADEPEIPEPGDEVAPVAVEEAGAGNLGNTVVSTPSEATPAPAEEAPATEAAPAEEAPAPAEAPAAEEAPAEAPAAE